MPESYSLKGKLQRRRVELGSAVCGLARYKISSWVNTPCKGHVLMASTQATGGLKATGGPVGVTLHQG